MFGFGVIVPCWMRSRMRPETRKAVSARERRFGPARVPVVAVSDNQRVVAATLARVELDRQYTVLVASCVLHAGLERDPLAQPEVVDIFLRSGAPGAPR
jgi:hypothetical protein